MKTLKMSFILGASAALSGFCADTNSITATNAVSYAPAVLPGKGLAQHSFLYTGEWDYRNTNQTIFLVRDSKVVWTYSIPIKDADGALQELGDATMLSNGNVVFCRKVGASEVTPDKKIIWNMGTPKGTELHSIQPIGLDHVLVTINGKPAGKLLLINTTTGNTEKEYTFPVLNPGANPHIQFRRVRKTKEGTSNGKIPTSARRLRFNCWMNRARRKFPANSNDNWSR